MGVGKGAFKSRKAGGIPRPFGRHHVSVVCSSSVSLSHPHHPFTRTVEAGPTLRCAWWFDKLTTGLLRVDNSFFLITYNDGWSWSNSWFRAEIWSAVNCLPCGEPVEPFPLALKSANSCLRIALTWSRRLLAWAAVSLPAFKSFWICIMSARSLSFKAWRGVPGTDAPAIFFAAGAQAGLTGVDVLVWAIAKPATPTNNIEAQTAMKRFITAFLNLFY